ncbi:5083_t:CDS:1, partial [Paraglomus occultum]
KRDRCIESDKANQPLKVEIKNDTPEPKLDAKATITAEVAT